MIKPLQNLPIQKKLLSILLFSSVSGLVIAAFFLLVFEVSDFKQKAQKELSTMAQLIANRSTAALTFDDSELAKENLSSLEKLTIVESACLYDKQGKIFTSFKVSHYHGAPCVEQYLGQNTYFERTLLHLYTTVQLDDDVLGVVYIRANLKSTFLGRLQSITLLFSALFMATVVTFLLTTPLLRVVTMPLNKLLKTVHNITQEKDYSQRALKQGNDEVGELVDAFNDMIETVEHQNSELTSAKNHYRALYNDNPTMVFNLNADGVIVSVNSFGAKQLDLSSQELQNRSIFDFVHLEDKLAAKMLFDLCIASPHKVHKQELRKVCRDGRIIWVRETVRMINENQKNSFLLVCEDVTETKMLSEKIVYQASHDALTDLVNRAQFDSVIQTLVKQAHKNQEEHALCYLDLDQFKVVNDTSGHLAGDELLRQLGNILKKQIRKGDMLARLGGDEFGILMNNCSLDEAFHACEKLRNIIRDFQFAWEDRSFSVGVSIGISSINQATGNAVDVLKEADSACYAAKERGRNRVHVFRPDDEDLALRQGEMQWVERIRAGLDENRFVLYGQLIVPIADKNQEGLHFETLVRFLDEKGKVIPPGAFLPAAERYNLATALDKWVISHLFEWLEQHPDCLNRLAVCSVNLSGLSLSDESMLDFITEAFIKYSIPTTKICFEITETAAIGNLNDATQFIQQLRGIGCSFSLDDFGSGLSSFAYLKNLPVDYLKIDGLFVKDILEDKVDLAMVKSINEVGHVMGKKTIAEFVENKEIFDLLNELGVDYAQGYGIAKPVPLSELL